MEGKERHQRREKRFTGINDVVVDDNVWLHLATDPDPSKRDFDSVVQRDHKHNPLYLETRYYLSEEGHCHHHDPWVDLPDYHSSAHKNLSDPLDGYLRETSV